MRKSPTGKKVLLAFMILTMLLSGLSFAKPVSASSGSALMGEIRLFPYGGPPSGWAYCNGQILSIAEYGELYSLIGTKYGGDGVTNFKLPDLRKAAPIDGVDYYISISGIFPTTGWDFILPLAGEIRLVAFDLDPGASAHWTDGSVFPKAGNESLFYKIGNAFGGDGINTFALPNLASINVPSDNGGTAQICYAISMSGFDSTELMGEEWLGQISLFPIYNMHANFYTPAEGQMYPIQFYAPLFALLDRRFAYNGTAFGLPDLSDASPVPYKLNYYFNTDGYFPFVEEQIPVSSTPDSYSLSQNGSLTVAPSSGVLANDTNASAAVVVAEPAHGSLTFHQDGTFTYIPNADFIGNDSFTYKANHNSASGPKTTVALSVNEPLPTIDGVAEGGVYAEGRTITFTGTTAQLNGNPFENGSIVSDEGTYTLVVTNGSGNSVTVHFSIDKTPPVITNAVINRDVIIFEYTEDLVKPDYFGAGDFQVKVNGEPVPLEFAAQIENERGVLAKLLATTATNNDEVTIAYAGGVATDAAGNAFSTVDVAVRNLSPGTFQSAPTIGLKLETDYRLQPGDEIVTFTPSSDRANVIRFDFPYEETNAPSLSVDPLIKNKSDYVIRDNTDGSTVPHANVSINNSGHRLELYLSSGVSLEAGKSYTVVMSATAGGDEISLPAGVTSSSSAYLALIQLNSETDALDEYYFHDVSIAPSTNRPSVALTGQSRTLTLGGAPVVVEAGQLATDEDAADLLRLGSPVSDEPDIVLVSLDSNGRLVLQPVRVGTTDVSVEVGDGQGHTVTATISVTVDQEKTPSPLPNDVTIMNHETGSDRLTVMNVAAQAIVHVYDSPSGGNRIGTATQGGMAGSLTVDVEEGIAGPFVYVTVTDVAALRSESDRVKIAVPPPVVKSALASSIVAAQAKHNAATEGSADGQYPTGSKAILQASITAASTVASDAAVTQAQVDAAVAALNAAVAEFETKVIIVNKSLLQTAIGAAQAKHDAATEGLADGQFPTGSKAILNAAITAASTVASNVAATQAQVDAAVAALNTAVAAFEAKIIIVNKSSLQTTIAAAQTKHDAATEGSADGQYPSGSKATLQASITAASTVVSDAAAMQAQVDAAIAALNAMVAEFESKVIMVNKSSLQTAIVAAQSKHDAATEGSADGQYPSGSKATLQASITAASTVVSDAAATQANVDATIAALNAAVAQFEAKKITIGSGGSGGTGSGDIGSAPASGSETTRDDELQMNVDPQQGGSGEIKDVAKLKVPAGAVPQDGKIFVAIVAPNQAPPTGGLEAVSQVVEFTSSTGHTFDKPLEITFHYETDKIGDGRQAAVYYYNELQHRWIYIGGTVNADGTVTVSVSHFTKFAVFEYEPAQFADLAGHWATAYTERFVGMKVIQGYPDRTFRPDETVTRAQFATMLAAALGLPATTGVTDFADDSEIPVWAKSAVSAAVKAGLVGGYSEQGVVRFKADQTISRAEMAVMIARALGAEENVAESGAGRFTDAAAIPEWAQAPIEAAVSAEILNGYEDGTFRPDHKATRAEAAAMIYKLLEVLKI
ncbi:tail fiber protein [Cohnella suwonensis]|uniref:Tail fiber protein n=1 Tax=Cohnella suwonensis TaxID=696072 RepID=A0ABW0M1S3_9BACL